MANVSGTEINLKPTQGMVTEAKRYKAWKEEGRAGGTQVAAVRASQIIRGEELSADVVVRMFSFFARHEVDKKAEGFGKGEKGYPSKGRVAWAAWGGDSGFSWSRGKAAAIKKARERSEVIEMARPYPNEHAATITNSEQFDTFRRSNDERGEGIDYIFGIKDNEEGAELQSIRFKLTQYSSSQALEWLEENEFEPIIFEPATNEKTMTEETKTVERAEPDALSVGDFVSWNSSGGRARGKIDRIVRDGSIDVPDSSFTITGTADDPAALITLYRDGEATDRKVGHKFSTLTKIADIRSIEVGDKFERKEVTDFKNVKSRTFEFPFSSEYPVKRYFGNEVLSHDEGAADLSRLNDGGAVLFNHDMNKPIGVVESAKIDPETKRGFAKIRFSRNKFASEVLEDVKDGILRGISFGYQINDMEEMEDGMRASSWSVHELSVVTVPADPTIGFGRSLISPSQGNSITMEDNSPLEEVRSAVESASPSVQTMEESTKETAVDTAPAVEIDIKAEVQRAIDENNARTASITSLCREFGKYGAEELADTLIKGNKTPEEAKAAILDLVKNKAEVRNTPIRSTDMATNEVGLEPKEVKRFSFLRALNALANPTDRQAQEAAAFEREVSEEASKRYDKPANGILVPNEVLKRDLNVGTATAGGNLVPTELLAGSFIDILRKRMAVMATNPTMLTGLSGNVAIPRMTSTSTAYFVGESGAPTESQQAFDQVNMTPKTVGAFVDYSRRLLLQSSIDVESMIRDDIAKVIATKLDNAAIYGSGSSNEPLGIKDTTGVGTQTITTFGTFAEYIGMETDVAAANADVASMFYLINASARGALKSTEKASNTAQFVFEDNSINGYPAIVSNQLANNDVLFGDFSQFVIGMWSGLDLTVDPYANATAGSVRIIALQDVDFGVKQPGAFCFGT
jgi:HK97 family phage major capsid protein/HK97 family phage prohead protease